MFDLNNKFVLITGSAGLLGPKHVEVILEYNGIPIITDINKEKLNKLDIELKYKYPKKEYYIEYLDITNSENIKILLDKYNIDILINNAAQNPIVTDTGLSSKINRFEDMNFQNWLTGCNVSINGTFLITQAVVKQMIEKKVKGVILNIASDLAVIAPDQRIYKKENESFLNQDVKPIYYSVVKHALIGFTKYLSTYLAPYNIRVNSLSPSGIYNNHPDDFVKKISNLIPLKRMANINEYKGAVIFSISEASSYMTGNNLIIDGGRTIW